MITIQIKHKTSGDILFEYACEGNTIKKTLEVAVAKKINLRSANLEGANLMGANLMGANLEGANLEGAYLEGTNIEYANLEYANLRGSYLEGANLEYANIEYANLRGSYLEGANLMGANLMGAYLEGAKGIMSFGPIGKENRICFLYVNKGIQCRLGCFNGDHNDAIEVIQKKYGVGSEYELMTRLAAWTLAKKTV